MEGENHIMQMIGINNMAKKTHFDGSGKQGIFHSCNGSSWILVREPSDDFSIILDNVPLGDFRTID